jgi:hypothetical protein
MPQKLITSSTALAVGALSFAAVASAQELYAPRTDWSSFTGGDLNISGFVFRDVNRNGIYDGEDRTMELVATRMTSPQGETLIRWTNFNGFANFLMDAGNPEADIPNPGLYDFEVIVPPGWEATTGNVVQTKRFSVTPGAVADMSADPPFHPVGLAPTLTIGGTVPTTDAETRVSVRPPSGEWGQMGRAGITQFNIPAEPGEWQIRMESDDGRQSVTRSVTVTEFPVQLSAGGTGAVEQPGDEVVIDFDDVTSRDIKEMPNGVGGLMWWNMIAYGAGQPAYTNNLVSGEFVGYNSSGHPARIWSPEPFSFVGGHFGVAWHRAHGETLRLRGYRRGELVYEDAITLSYIGPVWFQADYADIDRLDLATDRYWQFVTDDLHFLVPEPVSFD